MVGNEEIPQCIRAVMFQHVFDEEEIIQRLAHLFRIDGNEPVVQPVFDHRLLAVYASDWAISFS